MKPNEASGLNPASTLLPNLPQNSEIVVIRLRSLGDLVLETPAIAALHAFRPDLRISVLVEPRFAAVFEGNPAIAEVIFSRPSVLETTLELRKRRFTVVFNQHGGPGSAVLTGFSGSPWRVGWTQHQYSFLLNVRVPEVKEFYGVPAVHTVEHRMSQFYWTGLPRGPIPSAQVYPQAAVVESTVGILGEKGIAPGEPYAVLQPGARLPEMRWPLAKFAEIAGWLRKAHGIATVVNLGAQETEALPEVQRALQEHAAIPNAPLDLRELIALIAGSRIFIGNDSGPAHLAAALRRPSVVIFSLTDPIQWRPWHAPHRIVQTGASFDHPRGDKAIVTNNPRSISSIDIAEVQSACEGLLSAKRMEDNTHPKKW
ncbi:MAG: glycosyltransferase family 9 protein [Candidatus Acidiferrales bacterium]